MQSQTMGFITYLKNNGDTYKKMLKIIFPDKYSQPDNDLIYKFIDAFKELKLNDKFDLALNDTFIIVEELFI